MKSFSTFMRRTTFISRRSPSPVINTRSSKGFSMKRRIQASTGAASGASSVALSYFLDEPRTFGYLSAMRPRHVTPARAPD